MSKVIITYSKIKDAAKNAKTVAIGALWGFRTKDELERCGADAVILHPAQLLEFV